MKELLAACKGKKLKEREIEARIQHFLSVLKVTLLKSTQVDFASESWKGARLYHDKDQQKIDIFFFYTKKTHTYYWHRLQSYKVQNILMVV